MPRAQATAQGIVARRGEDRDVLRLRLADRVGEGLSLVRCGWDHRREGQHDGRDRDTGDFGSDALVDTSGVVVELERGKLTRAGVVGGANGDDLQLRPGAENAVSSAAGDRCIDGSVQQRVDIGADPVVQGCGVDEPRRGVGCRVNAGVYEAQRFRAAGRRRRIRQERRVRGRRLRCDRRRCRRGWPGGEREQEPGEHEPANGLHGAGDRGAHQRATVLLIGEVAVANSRVDGATARKRYFPPTMFWPPL
jgi:hypothetical protein